MKGGKSLSDQTKKNGKKQVEFFLTKTNRLNSLLNQYEAKTSEISSNVLDLKKNISAVKHQLNVHQNSQSDLSQEDFHVENRLKSLKEKIQFLRRNIIILKKDQKLKSEKINELENHVYQQNQQLTQNDKTIIYLSRQIKNLLQNTSSIDTKDIHNLIHQFQKNKINNTLTVQHVIQDYAHKYKSIHDRAEEQFITLKDSITNKNNQTNEFEYSSAGGWKQMFLNLWNKDYNDRDSHNKKIDELMETLKNVQNELIEYRGLFEKLENLSKQLEEDHKKEMNELKNLLKKMEGDSRPEKTKPLYSPSLNKQRNEGNEKKLNHLHESDRLPSYPLTNQSEGQKVIFNPFKYRQ